MTAQAADDEQEAIQQLRRGDIRGLDALVERYQLKAVRAANLITRDRALAEDIVQAAFLRAFERIGQFDPSRPFGPWFLRSVVNDAVKAASRRGRLVPIADDEAPEGGALEDRALGPELLIERGETREAVAAALDRLSPEQRAVVVQRYFLEMSEAEIAESQRVPAGTVKSRLFAAKGRLRELLRPLRAES